MPTSAFVLGLNLVLGEGSQEIRRLLTHRMRTQAMSNQGVRVHHTLVLYSSRTFPHGPLVMVPILGWPSLEASYPSLASQSLAWGQAEWSEGGRADAPAGKISFVSSVAYGPKVSLLSLSQEGLQFLNPGREVPKGPYVILLTNVHPIISYTLKK